MADISKITFQLPRELRQRFRIVAFEQDRPVAEILREFVQWYVEKKEAERV